VINPYANVSTFGIIKAAPRHLKAIHLVKRCNSNAVVMKFIQHDPKNYIVTDIAVLYITFIFLLSIFN